jgi:subtilase family serine protease
LNKSIAFTLMLAAATVGSAQINPRKSPAGEPPIALRNGNARLMGRFNAQQMIRLSVGLSHPHPQEEEEFVQSLTTPGSPNYRKFLTLDEFTRRFGPSVEDEQAVVDWAAGQGLTVTHRFGNRLIVDLEARAGAIENVFRVTINSYMLDGYSYYSNEREPVIPSHLSRIIQSIGGLNNFPEMRPSAFRGIDPPGPVYRPGPVIGEPTTGSGSASASAVTARRRRLADAAAPRSELAD